MIQIYLIMLLNKKEIIYMNKKDSKIVRLAIIMIKIYVAYPIVCICILKILSIIS
jgi:hypothetical protein